MTQAGKSKKKHLVARRGKLEQFLKGLAPRLILSAATASTAILVGHGPQYTLKFQQDMRLHWGNAIAALNPLFCCCALCYRREKGMLQAFGVGLLSIWLTSLLPKEGSRGSRFSISVLCERSVVSDCSIATISNTTAKGFTASPASTISKASWQSTNTIRIYGTMPNGSRFATENIRSGQDARNFSSVSGRWILISTCGTLALWPVTPSRSIQRPRCKDL